MILIVGLGNPGQKFQKTRHNIGFMVVESLKLKVKSFSNWKTNKKLLSEINQGEINGQKVILAKPQTFMNLSGKAVRLLMRWRKLECQDLVVVHDDTDLPFGKIKIVIGRGAAGHKGVESIIKELKTKNFIRFRIGIKPEFGKPKNVEKFVLQKFNKKEEKIVKEVIQNAVEVIEATLEEGTEKAMNKYNALSVAL